MHWIECYDRKLIAENAFHNWDLYLYLNYIQYFMSLRDMKSIWSCKMISTGSFLLLAAIVKQRICVVSNVIRFVGPEGVFSHFRFLETANIQCSLKRLTCRKWGWPYWGSYCFSQRGCGLLYVYLLHLSIYETTTYKLNRPSKKWQQYKWRNYDVLLNIAAKWRNFRVYIGQNTRQYGKYKTQDSVEWTKDGN